MINKDITIDIEGNEAKLTLYNLDSSPELYYEKRPIIVVCPGGGYSMVSDREAEPIAMKLASMGYHVAVLRYSVSPVRYPIALLQLGKVVSYLYENAEQYNIIKEKIAVMGFSAGGHLAASYSIKWNENWVAEKLGVSSEELRPDRMILCYPVITSGEFAHNGSFECLLGDKYDELKDELSIEKNINKDTPACFVWHTKTDNFVPYENTLMLIDSLKEKNIPVESHIFDKGDHGLSLANKVSMDKNKWGIEESVQVWTDYLEKWLDVWRNE